MAILPLIYAPNKIFSMQASKVEKIDNNIRSLIDDMFESLYHYNGIGIGANMLGILKRIVVIDLQKNNLKNPLAMINPEIIEFSKEKIDMHEASLSFRGVSASIKRAKKITVNYIDYNGCNQTLIADGLLARVIMHEIDYLNGIVFLDHLSKIKKDLLMKKMLKFIKNNGLY